MVAVDLDLYATEDVVADVEKNVTVSADGTWARVAAHLIGSDFALW